MRKHTPAKPQGLAFVPKAKALASLIKIHKKMISAALVSYPDSKVLKELVPGGSAKLVFTDYLPTDIDRLAVEYQCASFLRKSPIARPDITAKGRAQKALETTMAAEAQCKKTNSFFLAYQKGNFCLIPHLALILNWIKADLQELLGSITEGEVIENARFGPGVTLDLRGLSPNAVDKLTTETSGTAYACYLYQSAFCDSRVLREGWLSKVKDGKKLVVHHEPLARPGFPTRDIPLLPIKRVYTDSWIAVAKTAETDRGICIAPGANIMFQLGLGKAIRNRLYRWGLHLDKQWKVNHELARKGSLGLGFDTVDLKSASDTVSRELVRFLIQDTSCFGIFEGLRTNATTYPDGKCLYNERYSAMGNGFTFELETAIFAAATRAVYRFFGFSRIAGPESFSVFGDDICVRSEATPLLIEVLELLGFSINLDKSFTSGYFRESCGKDYLAGFNVRPYFSTEEQWNDVSFTMLANGIRRWTERLVTGHESGLADARFRTTWLACVDCIVEPLPCYGGSEADSHLLVCDNDFNVVRPKLHARNSVLVVRGYTLRRGAIACYPDEAILAFALWSSSMPMDPKGYRSYLARKLSGPGGYKVGRVPVRELGVNRWVG